MIYPTDILYGIVYPTVGIVSWNRTPILGWHTYQVTLTGPNEIDFIGTTCKVPGHTMHSWIMHEIPGHIASNHVTITR